MLMSVILKIDSSTPKLSKSSIKKNIKSKPKASSKKKVPLEHEKVSKNDNKLNEKKNKSKSINDQIINDDSFKNDQNLEKIEKIETSANLPGTNNDKKDIVESLTISKEEVASSSSSSIHNKKIIELREKGVAYISLKDYSTSSKCYLAALQLMENTNSIDDMNTDSVDNVDVDDKLRRRCILTLSECCIKEGKYHDAIARCSELVDEFYYKYTF